MVLRVSWTVLHSWTDHRWRLTPHRKTGFISIEYSFGLIKKMKLRHKLLVIIKPLIQPLIQLLGCDIGSRIFKWLLSFYGLYDNCGPCNLVPCISFVNTVFLFYLLIMSCTMPKHSEGTNPIPVWHLRQQFGHFNLYYWWWSISTVYRYFTT